MRTRSGRVVAAALLTALALSGCSDDGDGDETATDPTATPTPTASPTVGSYPEFAPEDYVYTLTTSCFCPDAGIPVRVTVSGGDVTSAVYDESGRGYDKGAPVPDFRAITINDIIDELNAATDAESVQVRWPEGQGYPSLVSIDQSSRIADEEIGYTIRRVETR